MNSSRSDYGDFFQPQQPPLTSSASDSSSSDLLFQTALPCGLSFPTTATALSGTFPGMRRQRREVLSVIEEDDDSILFKARLRKQTASQCLADLADSVNSNNATSQDPCSMETEQVPYTSSCLFPSHTESVTPVEAADDDWGYFYADSSPDVGTTVAALYASKRLGQRVRRKHNSKYPRGRCSPSSTMLLPPKHPPGGLCQP